MKNRAIFFDRDGILNDLVYHNTTREYEPPHNPTELIIIPDAINVIKILQKENYLLIVISNQPDYAKGKTSFENLLNVHKKLESVFLSEKISFSHYYYCYHHPDGIIASHSIICECRKPEPYFLFQAAVDFSIDLNQSWMIGDRDTDIECGKRAGVKTILINYPFSKGNRGNSYPDYVVENIYEIIPIINMENNENNDE
ncbi:D-glycero-alpha-D-manno-heptose-1,7-bisphosphate 7-phosphatase [Methanospirillum stamsii]|uniref:D,D-heptose 1,7-bisphosphate phosphatase n=1 Tax=Methanospirillum stamsii TaxID=1277351 RepID=A0A2V2N8M2_9EURY|nr:HAD-IIIA family hydrolase [Methanospirillum stamsii]PWR76189.1 histidinol-phosphatase [Methanospirillum stamsii]